jgi:hypothetical protein
MLWQDGGPEENSCRMHLLDEKGMTELENDPFVTSNVISSSKNHPWMLTVPGERLLGSRLVTWPWALSWRLLVIMKGQIYLDMGKPQWLPLNQVISLSHQ